MAIDMAAGRAEGVMPLPADAAKGTPGPQQNGSSAGHEANFPMVDEPTISRTPGPTRDFRDVGPNTAWSGPGNTGEPMIDAAPAGEVPRGVPFNTPDASGLMATDRAHSDWDDQGVWGADVSSKNTRPIALNELSTFDMMGEEPQGEGLGEGLEGGE